MSDEQQQEQKTRVKPLKTIVNHLQSDWYKYVIQAFVVISGIIIAFALEKWHLTDQENQEFNYAYRLMAEELKEDTVQFNSLLGRFEERRMTYEQLLNGKMNREAYDDCHYCPRLVTSIYTLSSSDLGFQHVSDLKKYSLHASDSLNYLIEKYYLLMHKDVPMWQNFIRNDIQENIHHWKLKKEWYFERENRPEAMVDYQLNSPEYKNMVYVQRNLIYKNYVPLLKKLRIQAIRILYKIDQKLN